MTPLSDRVEVSHCKSGTNLVSVQPVTVWERLRREKCLFVNPAQPNFYGSRYQTAYDWLREQMHQRLRMRQCLSGYGGHYSWWAWLTREPKCGMKGAWVYGDGETRVRLELCIAPERLRVSEFSVWHEPLCGTYLGLSCAEDEAWQAECRTGTGQDSARLAELPPDMQARVRRSWKHCFDAPVMDKSEFFTMGLYQAMFKELRPTDVS